MKAIITANVHDYLIDQLKQRGYKIVYNRGFSSARPESTVVPFKLHSQIRNRRLSIERDKAKRIVTANKYRGIGIIFCTCDLNAYIGIQRRVISSEGL